MAWIQRTIELRARPRGLHPITHDVVAAMPELALIRVGLLHVFLQHTSASLTINENADPDVPADLEVAVSAIAPEDAPYRHTCEGRDDMPAHVNTMLTGVSLHIPVLNGKLALGTWQAIYLIEHRARPHRREIVLQFIGGNQ